LDKYRGPQEYYGVMERQSKWRKIAKLMDDDKIPVMEAYAAPEVLLGKPSVKSDWWTLGVILFELLLGFHPFCHNEDPNDTNYNIINWKHALNPRILSTIDLSAADLITKLLCGEDIRLDADQIKNHSYFKNINWSVVEERLEPAPFILQGVSKSIFSTYKMDTAMNYLIEKEKSLLTNFAYN